MSEAVSRYAVLGTLVDRAVCMPFAKPQVLQGGRLRNPINAQGRRDLSTIRAQIGLAAQFLVDSLESPNADEDWSPAELGVDPAGPWWSKTLNDFTILDPTDQSWVLDRLFHTADLAASVIGEAAGAEGWAWLWSQPSFAKPGPRGPSITRPDLIGGLDAKRCLVIDLKTTSNDDLDCTIDEYQAAAFATWSRSLTAMGFEPIQNWILRVSTNSRHHKWLEV